MVCLVVLGVLAGGMGHFQDLVLVVLAWLNGVVAKMCGFR